MSGKHPLGLCNDTAANFMDHVPTCDYWPRDSIPLVAANKGCPMILNAAYVQGTTPPRRIGVQVGENVNNELVNREGRNVL